MSLSSIPRPILIALVGGIAVGALLFMTRSKSSEESSDSGGSSQVTTTTTPTPSDSTGDSKTQDSTGGSQTKEGTGSATKPETQSQGRVDQTALPKPVQKALDQKKVVVVLFWRSAAVEDRLMQKVAAIVRKASRNPDEFASNSKDQRELRKIEVFEPGVGALTRWVKIVGAEGVPLTPAYIVVDSKGRSDFQTGFLDPATMTNSILNAIYRKGKSSTTTS
jgi:hypothetical protein